MAHLELSSFGSNFLSILNYESLYQKIQESIERDNNLLIDFNNVNNVSPSFLTKLLRHLQDDLGYNVIEIKNANRKLETTFKFAMHSIKRSKELC